MDIGIAASNAATVLGLMGGSNILGRLIMGPVSDRSGRKTSAVASALLASGAMVWLAWSRDLWAFYLFSLVFGFSWGGISATTTALMADTYGLHNLGVIMAVMNIGFSTGAAIGPFIGGYIFDVSHSYLIAFLVGALLMLVTAISAAVTRKELYICAP